MPFLGAETALAFVGAFPRSLAPTAKTGGISWRKPQDGICEGYRTALMIRAMCSSSRAGDDTCGQREPNISLASLGSGFSRFDGYHI